MKKHFKTPIDAEKHYFPVSVSDVQPQPTAVLNVAVQTELTLSSSAVQTESTYHDVACQAPPGDGVHRAASQTDTTDYASNLPSQSSADSQLELLSKSYHRYMLANFAISVPDDFLSLAAKAMAQLRRSERTNVLYTLAKGIGTPREDGSDSRFPTRRMPMGLLEHIANFFVAEKMHMVSAASTSILFTTLIIIANFWFKIPSCPKDYRLWQQTMYVQFGQKWCKLHHGPLWRVVSSTQNPEGGVTCQPLQTQDTMDVSANLVFLFLYYLSALIPMFLHGDNTPILIMPTYTFYHRPW